jgi:hypothetical protein
MMDKSATMTATPDEIVNKLVETEAAMKRDNGVPPEAELFARKGDKGGDGGNAGNGGRSPKRDKRDNKKDNNNDRKLKDFRNCFHSQWRGHTTEHCLSRQHGNPPKSADTAAKASTEALATLTFTTAIENYWMVASSGSSTMIGSLIADVRLTSPAINQGSSPILNILRICRL